MRSAQKALHLQRGMRSHISKSKGCHIGQAPAATVPSMLGREYRISHLVTPTALCSGLVSLLADRGAHCSIPGHQPLVVVHYQWQRI